MGAVGESLFLQLSYLQAPEWFYKWRSRSAWNIDVKYTPRVVNSNTVIVVIERHVKKVTTRTWESVRTVVNPSESLHDRWTFYNNWCRGVITPPFAITMKRYALSSIHNETT